MSRPDEIDDGHRMKSRRFPGDGQSVMFFLILKEALLTFGRRMEALVPTNRLTGWISNVDLFIALDSCC